MFIRRSSIVHFPIYGRLDLSRWTYLRLVLTLVIIYLDSAYFSIVTITKIGFGDYIPRMVPPDFAADYIFNQQWCLRGKSERAALC